MAAPAVITGVFVITFLSAVPLAWMMRETLELHLGRSLAAAEAADAVNFDWWQEFAAQASGIGGTFSPSIIGFASTLDSLSRIFEARMRSALIAMAIAAYLLVWIFLSGGIIDRYARQRPTRSHGFFAASGVFFLRFLRLGIVAGFLYWLLYRYVHEWIFTDWYTRATRDLAVERMAFYWLAGMYVLFGALLASVNLLFDYAKIRASVEDRRSAIGALVAAGAFIMRHPRRVAGLYGINVLTFLALIAVWAFIAPGAGRAGAGMWIGFAVTQLYLLARLALKLQFLASQTSLFQASLAHARYTAAPEPVWPESPAAETISTS